MKQLVSFGVSISCNSGRVTVVEIPGFDNVIYESGERTIKDDQQVGKESVVLSNFILEEVTNFSRSSGGGGDNAAVISQVVIAVKHLFEYGQSFPEELRETILQKLSSRESDGFDSTATTKIEVRSLDAAAYLGCFDGVVINADTGVSAAIRDPADNGAMTVIEERGHMIGDPGSAYWLANKCLRMIYDNADGIELTNFDVSAATRAANEYFQMTNPLDILKPMYTEFSKEKIASFCVCLARLADDGCAFCLYLFKEAGRRLGVLCGATLVKAIRDNKGVASGISELGNVKVLGVGRMWEYYHLIETGFFDSLKAADIRGLCGLEIRHLEIYKWTSSDSHAVALFRNDNSTNKNIPVNHLRKVCAESF